MSDTQAQYLSDENNRLFRELLKAEETIGLQKELIQALRERPIKKNGWKLPFFFGWICGIITLFWLLSLVIV